MKLKHNNKEYKDLKAGDYFIGKIAIIELVEKYKLKELLKVLKSEMDNS
jgi:hypothetical protein